MFTFVNREASKSDFKAVKTNISIVDESNLSDSLLIRFSTLK